MPILYEVLEDIEQLPIEEKLFLEEEVHKRNIEAKRKLLLEEIAESKKEYEEGKYKSFSNADDFLEDLDSEN